MYSSLRNCVEECQGKRTLAKEITGLLKSWNLQIVEITSFPLNDVQAKYKHIFSKRPWKQLNNDCGFIYKLSSCECDYKSIMPLQSTIIPNNQNFISLDFNCKQRLLTFNLSLVMLCDCLFYFLLRRKGQQIIKINNKLSFMGRPPSLVGMIQRRVWGDHEG